MFETSDIRCGGVWQLWQEVSPDLRSQKVVEVVMVLSEMFEGGHHLFRSLEQL